MIKILIGEIKKDKHIKENYGFLNVPCSFVEVDKDGEETVIGTIKRAYPMGTKTAEIKADLKKARKTFLQDRDRAVENADVEMDEKNADAVIKDLEGSEIKK